MKRIIVIGCPGSGKSTFSKKLHNITDIELFHLDMMFWNSDGTTVPQEVFREQLSEVLGKEAWIIDGDYASTMELRIQMCDTVFFLDYPTQVCLEGIRSRIGKARSDMPWVETAEDEELIKKVLRYNSDNREKVLELIGRYQTKEIHIFKSRREADEYIDALIHNSR